MHGRFFTDTALPTGRKCSGSRIVGGEVVSELIDFRRYRGHLRRCGRSGPVAASATLKTYLRKVCFARPAPTGRAISSSSSRGSEFHDLNRTVEMPRNHITPTKGPQRTAYSTQWP